MLVPVDYVTPKVSEELAKRYPCWRTHLRQKGQRELSLREPVLATLADFFHPTLSKMKLSQQRERQNRKSDSSRLSVLGQSNCLHNDPLFSCSQHNATNNKKSGNGDCDDDMLGQPSHHPNNTPLLSHSVTHKNGSNVKNHTQSKPNATTTKNQRGDNVRATPATRQQPPRTAKWASPFSFK